MHGGWTTGVYKGHPSEALSKYSTDQSDHPGSREKIPPFFRCEQKEITGTSPTATAQ